jgi:hypothetical protein
MKRQQQQQLILWIAIALIAYLLLVQNNSHLQSGWEAVGPPGQPVGMSPMGNPKVPDCGIEELNPGVTSDPDIHNGFGCSYDDECRGQRICVGRYPDSYYGWCKGKSNCVMGGVIDFKQIEKDVNELATIGNAKSAAANAVKAAKANIKAAKAKVPKL